MDIGECFFFVYISQVVMEVIFFVIFLLGKVTFIKGNVLVEV